VCLPPKINNHHPNCNPFVSSRRRYMANQQKPVRESHSMAVDARFDQHTPAVTNETRRQPPQPPKIPTATRYFNWLWKNPPLPPHLRHLPLPVHNPARDRLRGTGDTTAGPQLRPCGLQDTETMLPRIWQVIHSIGGHQTNQSTDYFPLASDPWHRQNRQVFYDYDVDRGRRN
jgi:hypothetical protein